MRSYDESVKKTFIILGGAGDLAERLLIPGIAEYAAIEGVEFTIVGAGRTDPGDYAQFVRDAASAVDEGVAEDLASRAEFVVADATKSEDLRTLMKDRGDDVVVYFALAPEIAVDSVEAMKGADVPTTMTFAMEKPFGDDADGAAELNARLLELLDEEQIFRVDHFLATSGALNFDALRTANRLITSSWSNEDVQEMTFTYNETVALEGRAEFYESTGAAEDMLQSHLLQTLARILVEGDATPEDILRAITPQSARKARYTEGAVEGEKVPAYVDEEGVDPANDTETWFRVVVDVDTPTWTGVPMTLESGKAFKQDTKEICLTFKPNGDYPANTLTLGFDDDDIAITLNAADPAREASTVITLSADLAPTKMSAYGRVVKGIVEQIDYLAVPADAAVLGWDAMERIGRLLADAEMEEYPAGVDRIE